MSTKASEGAKQKARATEDAIKGGK